jgi:hypothetical protein
LEIFFNGLPDVLANEVPVKLLEALVVVVALPIVAAFKAADYGARRLSQHILFLAIDAKADIVDTLANKYYFVYLVQL